MLRTVVLHGALAARFGSSFELDIKSPAEALRALMLQIKGFRQAFREGNYRVIRATKDVASSLDLEELKLRLGRSREIHIVPVIAGSGLSGWGKVLAGVAIIGLAIAAPYALGLAGGLSATFGAVSAVGFSGISFGQIAAFGALTALAGISQVISPAPSLKGGSASTDRKESFLFGSGANTTAQGGPVPLVFGEFIVGSVVVSSGLSTEEIGMDPASGVLTGNTFVQRTLLGVGAIFGQG